MTTTVYTHMHNTACSTMTDRYEDASSVTLALILLLLILAVAAHN